MDRFQQLQVFVAVAEEQGFAAAARRLQMSPPAVTRAIAALEAQVGVQLLQRSTRWVRATDAGLRYLDDARRILAELDAADEGAAGVHAQARGHLSITAPVMFGRLYVMPGVIDYLGRYPATTAATLFVDRVVNLLEEGLDVGVRIGELPDSNLRALRVGSVRRVVCAAPDYLARAGRPGNPAELEGHRLIVSHAGSAPPGWRFCGEHGERSERSESSDHGGQLVRTAPQLSVNTNDAAIAAAVAGFGITRLLSYQVASQLADGSLVTLLTDYECPALPIHIVHRESRHPAVKVRAFIDLLAERLRADPALGGPRAAS